MQKLALAWHKARDHQLSCLLNFQCSLFLAEEKVWVELLFRTDNKCSGLEPKLATGLYFRRFKSRFATVMENLGQTKCKQWRIQAVPVDSQTLLFCDTDKCVLHIHTMSYFSLFWKDHGKPALPRWKASTLCIYITALSSPSALWETSSQSCVPFWFYKDKLYSVREKGETFACLFSK